MKKRALVVWISVIVAMTMLAGCGAGGAQGTNITVSDVGNVEGVVKDAQSSALLSGVTVQVGDKTAVTGTTGIYSIQDIAVGSRTITASMTSYQTYSNNVTITKGTTVTDNISLAPNGGGTSDTTAPANTTSTNFINSGAASTSSTSVTMAISATDAVGVTAYYASETSTTPSASATGWTTITSTTSYSDSVSFTLSSGDGTKTVYVWFMDAAGNVSSSVSGSITLSIGTVTSLPAAPTGVSAAAGNTQTTITWTAVTGATSYNIYFSTTAGVTTANGTKITGATSPYIHTGLTNGTIYYYIVTAVNLGGESAASTQVSAMPVSPVPSAPTGVSATSGNAQATVSWTAVTGAASYNIYYSTTAGVTTATGTKIPTVTSPYIHAGLTNGITYYYIVTAANLGGESTASTQVSAKPVLPVPATPTGISAMAGNAQNTITWPAVTGADSYNIYWSTTAGVTTATGTKIPTVTSPYTHAGLTNGITYYYIVTAANLGGESAASTQVSATPLPPIPSAPTGVNATAGNGQNTINWTNVTGADSYNIYWSTTPGVTTATGTKLPTVTSPYTQAGLTNGITCYYIVTAVNAGGESASTQVSAKPVPPIPATPTGVSAAAGDTQNTITWTAVTGATSYNVYWSTTTGVTTASPNKITVTTSTYTHTALTNGTTYYYIVTAANLGGESTASAQVSAMTQAGIKQWTIMVYLAADNSLSSFGLVDLNEMEKIGSDANINIVVQAEFKPNVNPNTLRFLVQNDNNPAAPNLAAGTSMGNLDMTNPTTMTQFIQWAKTNYPAQHYALVMWDHGAGWRNGAVGNPMRGAIEDATSNPNAIMSIQAIAKAVQASGVTPDVLNWDACLMGMYEVAYEFNGLTQYMVSSEETTPGDGNPYDLILGDLAANPAMTGLQFANVIANRFNGFYTSIQPDFTQISVLDMAQVPALDQAVINLATEIQALGTPGYTAVAQAVKTTQNYYYVENRDIFHLSSILSQNLVAGTPAQVAAANLAALQNTVIPTNLISTSAATSLGNSKGAAIFLPGFQAQLRANDLLNYSQLKSNINRPTSWYTLVNGFLNAGGSTILQVPGGFGVKIDWAGSDSDLDLWVIEPDGQQYHPAVTGMTSPEGTFTGDADGTTTGTMEIWTANNTVTSGTYKFVISYWANGPTSTSASPTAFVIDPQNAITTWQAVGTYAMDKATNPQVWPGNITRSSQQAGTFVRNGQVRQSLSFTYTKPSGTFNKPTRR